MTENFAVFVPKVTSATSTGEPVLPKTDNINRRTSGVSELKVPHGGKAVTSEQFDKQSLDIAMSREFAQESISSHSNDSEDTSVVDTGIMNIKITNVTSLPPEIFASVGTGHEGSVEWPQTEPVSAPPLANTQPLEKWFVTHTVPTLKRGIYEEGNSKKKEIRISHSRTINDLRVMFFQ